MQDKDVCQHEIIDPASIPEFPCFLDRLHCCYITTALACIKCGELFDVDYRLKKGEDVTKDYELPSCTNQEFLNKLKAFGANDIMIERLKKKVG